MPVLQQEGVPEPEGTYPVAQPSDIQETNPQPLFPGGAATSACLL